MPTYAILGSTGNVGGSLLEVLLESPANHVHAYCRSKEKLLKQLPRIVNDERVQIFEGAMENVELLSACLKDTTAAFLAVAIKGNQPGTTIAQDTAHAVLSALERLKAKGSVLPKLVVLSSASTEHRLMRKLPNFMLRLIYAANANIYQDLEKAERTLRSSTLPLSITFIKPGALSHDSRKGHTLNLSTADSPVSFLDLAAGMVEVAEERSDRYDGKAVAVNATAKNVAIPYDSAPLLLKGLLVYLFPWLWRFIGSA